jgi:hypothetical protein
LQYQRSLFGSLDIAYLYYHLGDIDQFFTWLEKAYEERAYSMAYLKVSLVLDSIHSDPKFIEWLKKMKLD